MLWQANKIGKQSVFYGARDSHSIGRPDICMGRIQLPSMDYTQKIVVYTLETKPLLEHPEVHLMELRRKQRRGTLYGHIYDKDFS